MTLDAFYGGGTRTLRNTVGKDLSQWFVDEPHMSTAAFAGVALGRFYPSVQAPRHQLHVACKGRGRGKRAEHTSNGVGEEGGGGGGVLMPGACGGYGCGCELIYTHTGIWTFGLGIR